MNKCYQTKAYTATLVMAGSILESFLVNWIEERYNHYYDNNDNLVIIKPNGNTHTLYGLSDYIYQMRFLDRPSWMNNDFNNKATQIRRKRNLVHGILCLRENAVINKVLCDEVISYLNDIIDETVNKSL